MTATETLYPELSADLVEQVRNLPAAGIDSLTRLLHEQRELDEAYETELRAELLRRIEAYDKGEIKAFDWRDATEQLEARLRTAFPEASA